MSLMTRIIQRHRGDERGMAMVVTLMVIVMLTGISTTVAVMAVQNTKNADRDRQAQGALDVADAGVTAGVEYLRTASLGTITCPETSVTGTFTSTDTNCTSATAWSNPISPQSVTTNGVPITAGVLNTIEVKGHTGANAIAGTYTGTMTFAAGVVPEPASSLNLR